MEDLVVLVEDEDQHRNCIQRHREHTIEGQFSMGLPDLLAIRTGLVREMRIRS